MFITGFVSQKEIPRYVSLADLCINPFRENFVTTDIIPTKILEYLACQKPVLSSPLNGTKELIPDEKYGVDIFLGVGLSNPFLFGSKSISKLFADVSKN